MTDQNSILYNTIGVVKDVDDPHQMGRLRVFCPSLDDENTIVEELPWAWYVSPFYGSTMNMKAGHHSDTTYGPTGYGFWSIPKLGSIVLVSFVNGDPNYRVWTGCVVTGNSTNRSMPHGRTQNQNGEYGPWSDSYEKMEPAYSNLRKAGLDKDPTRGVEKQIAQAKTEKDGSNGYGKDIGTEKYLDSQRFMWNTPGHHFILMDDDKDNCRIRFKTTAGNQIILDDTNGRIYISSSLGQSWLEMDVNGDFHLFTAKNFSIRSGKDINLAADGKVNIEGKKGINIKSDGIINIDSNTNINVSAAGSIYETACASLHLKAVGNLIETGAIIHLNGSPADKAGYADSPSVVPEHEPWNRPK